MAQFNHQSLIAQLSENGFDNGCPETPPSIATQYTQSGSSRGQAPSRRTSRAVTSGIVIRAPNMDS